MREGGGLGGCLFQVLLILVILALIGIVDWSTVGDWAIFMLVLAISGVLLVGLGSIYSLWINRE